MGAAEKRRPAGDALWRDRAREALVELLLAAIRQPVAANDGAGVEPEPRRCG